MNNTKPKSVQIDYDLFLNMAAYISEHVDLTDPALKSIFSGIREKLDSMERRALYTAYKVALSAEDRENARQKYLEMMEIPESFRWSTAQDVNVTHKECWD